MHRLFRRVMRDNAGQATVLAALTLIVLALVVVSTTQVSTVVHEKIRLQQAADNLAYSTAVVEARAYNLIAYTNRAMVLHYQAMMTFAAYLSHAQYLDYTIMPILSAVAAILQFFGIPGCQVVKAMRYWYAILDGHNPALAPLNFCDRPTYGSHGAVELAIAYLSAANEALYVVQEAALMYAGAFVLASESFAQKTDPKAELPLARVTSQYSEANTLPEPLIPGALTANAFVVNNLLSLYAPAEHRDTNRADSVGDDYRRKGLPFYPSYRGSSQPRDQYARFLMMEIANASRDEWTAGVKDGPIFLGRKWWFDLGRMLLGGSFACGTLLAGLIKIAGLVAAAFGAGPLAALSMFFGMRLEKTAETRLRGFDGGGQMKSDQIFSAERFIVKDTVAGKKKSCLCCGVNLKGCKSCVNWVCLPPNVHLSCDEIGRLETSVEFDNGSPSAPTVGLFSPTPLSGSAENGGSHVVRGRAKLNFFGIAAITIGPYSVSNPHKKHYFKGITPYVGGRPGPQWPQVAHFNNPCNTAWLVKDIPGNGVRRAWTYEGSTVDFSRGKSLYLNGPLWRKDMAAVAVGRAYYHHPGNWKEPPNMFLPLWFGRLAPVREHWLFAEGFSSGSKDMCDDIQSMNALPLDWLALMCQSADANQSGAIKAITLGHNATGSAARVILH